MFAERLDRVLAVTEKIHPLMGPIFTSRPNSSSVGEQCSMCLDTFPSDTSIIDSSGQTRFVCLSHELMLRAAFTADKNGQLGVDHYEAYVLERIMQDASKPWWMPLPVYKRLRQRAASKARLLAVLMFLGMARPLRYTQLTPKQEEPHGNL